MLFTTEELKEIVTPEGVILNRHTGKPRAREFNQHGTQIVKLHKNKTFWSTTVQNLVALVYVPNPNNYKHVLTKDGDKSNVRADNLEWVSNEELIRRTACTKVIMGNDHYRAKLNEDSVRTIRSLLPYYNNYQIAEMFNVSNATIRAIRVGLTWKHVE